MVNTWMLGSLFAMAFCVLKSGRKQDAADRVAGHRYIQVHTFRVHHRVDGLYMVKG